MNSSWRKGLLGIAAGAGLVLSVACGSSTTPASTPNPSGSTSQGSTGTTQQAAAPAATEDPRADWPREVRLGFFGGDDDEAVLERVEPMRVYLEERLGLPVQIFTGTSYSAVIEAMRAKRVEGMLVGPFSYVLAVQEAGAEAIAVSISCSSSQEVCAYDESRSPHYFSVIMTKKGNGIETIDDLRGKDFAFVDPASTSGHLAPKTLILQSGVDPDTEMRTVFAGSHPSAVFALQNDNVPATATHEGNVLSLINSGQIDACFYEDGIANRATPRTPEEMKKMYDDCEDGRLVMIAQTDPIPNTPFGIRGDLPESFKAAFKEALLDVKNIPSQVESDRRWFVDPTEELGFAQLDHYYNSLRDIARLLDLDLAALD